VRPLLLLEINEVPWRVIDLATPRFAATREFFARARTLTTISDDSGELSPWVTWPSLHRGMNNRDHGIRHLGQDVSTFAGTPIWEEYRAQGLSIGICGSLQSWPPRDPGENGFYVPDTFAHDARTIPPDIAPLQQLNLDLVRKNGLVSRRLDLLSWQTLRALPALGRRISARTFSRIAAQLVSERLQPARKARRAIFQTLLFWDVFCSLYDVDHPPALATFFTNHVASTMHRYWSHVFPDDFPEATDRQHAPTFLFSLGVMNEILARALEWQKRNPSIVLVFATSMGQEAVHREKIGRAASVTDLPRLLRLFDAGDHKPLLAMVPQVAVELADAAQRSRLKTALDACRSKSGAPAFAVDEVAQSLSITLRVQSRDDLDAGGLWIGAERWCSFADAGISVDAFDEGTGYHQPQGILAVVGNGIAASAERKSIPLTAVKNLLVDLGGVRSAAS
jgi:hypothetical protein